MVELHGWITIRDTYKVDNEDNIDNIIGSIQNEIEKLKHPSFKIKVANGEYYIEFSLFSNHRAKDLEDLLSFFNEVGTIANGSYGLIYLHDDEDTHGKNNIFQVFRLARGKVNTFNDKFLSPFIPTVEDKWI